MNNMDYDEHGRTTCRMILSCLSVNIVHELVYAIKKTLFHQFSKKIKRQSVYQFDNNIKLKVETTTNKELAKVKKGSFVILW